MRRTFVGLSLVCLWFVLTWVSPSVSGWGGPSPIPTPLAALDPIAEVGPLPVAPSEPLAPTAWLYLPVLLRRYQPPSEWITIVSEDFEGAFPGPWLLEDDIDGFGEYFWAKRDCRPYAGSYSGWAVGGGADGASLACGAAYPNDVSSWMTYGPFSLVGATAAELTFKLWLEVEVGYDEFSVAVSTDGRHWSGWTRTDSSSGWIDMTLDLQNVPDLGSVLGNSQVWVALGFDADSSESLPEGAYVDDIVLRKCAAPACTAMAASGRSQPGFVPVTMSGLR